MYSNFEKINKMNNQNFQAMYEKYNEESKKYINTKDVLEQESQKLGEISDEIERIQRGIDNFEGGVSLNYIFKYIDECAKDLRFLKNDIRWEKASVDRFLEDPSKRKIPNAPYTELLN